MAATYASTLGGIDLLSYPPGAEQRVAPSQSSPSKGIAKLFGAVSDRSSPLSFSDDVFSATTPQTV
jgi:hypothetical protein